MITSLPFHDRSNASYTNNHSKNTNTPLSGAASLVQASNVKVQGFNSLLTNQPLANPREPSDKNRVKFDLLCMPSDTKMTVVALIEEARSLVKQNRLFEAGPLYREASHQLLKNECVYQRINTCCGLAIEMAIAGDGPLSSNSKKILQSLFKTINNSQLIEAEKVEAKEGIQKVYDQVFMKIYERKKSLYHVETSLQTLSDKVNTYSNTLQEKALLKVQSNKLIDAESLFRDAYLAIQDINEPSVMIEASFSLANKLWEVDIQSFEELALDIEVKTIVLAHPEDYPIKLQNRAVCFAEVGKLTAAKNTLKAAYTEMQQLEPDEKIFAICTSIVNHLKALDTQSATALAKTIESKTLQAKILFDLELGSEF